MNGPLIGKFASYMSKNTPKNWLYAFSGSSVSFSISFQHISLISFSKVLMFVLLNILWYVTVFVFFLLWVFLPSTFVLDTCTMGRWSEISLKIMPFKLFSTSSTLFVKILSISVAVWLVILVALLISYSVRF
jgi:hypothetical protein